MKGKERRGEERTGEERRGKARTICFMLNIPVLSALRHAHAGVCGVHNPGGREAKSCGLADN
jgi:hypothetical protein